ncbi:MAG TPA: hypothetical protein VJO53_13910 [Candidatus Acidoferrales bacterium]|nr:hypothetical protein [Candidatus Acidoferrales bacterium]
MKIFRRIVTVLWILIPVNLLFSIVFSWYRYHVPYQVEGFIVFFAVLFAAVYKIGQTYRAGMNR